MNGRFFRDQDGAYSREIGATTGVALHPDRLSWPLRKRSWRGKRVFVCSSADLFHDQVPDDYIAHVFAVMAATPQVTYQVLTKRSARMRSLLSSGRFADMLGDTLGRLLVTEGVGEYDVRFPLPNVWLGVSAEDQATADRRIPDLLDTPAAVRWVSAEPLIGPIDLHFIEYINEDCRGCSGILSPAHEPGNHAEPGAWCGIDWVVVGGESGPGCRPMDVEWARSLRDQCRNAGVPFFMKQLGGHPHKRDALEDLPEDLRIRQYPGGESRG